VIGSRNFTDYAVVREHLSNIAMTVMVSGGARGADAMGEKYADEMGILKEVYLPDYDKYGRAAPFVRNGDIIKNSEVVLAFWDGKSNGTRDSLNKCVKLKIPHKIIYPDRSLSYWDKDHSPIKY
jgi:hypothetical protein